MKSGQTIDFHAHILHPKLLELSSGKTVITGFGNNPGIDLSPGSRHGNHFQIMLKPDLHIAEMDRRKIDVHVLSSSTVAQGTYWASHDQEPKLCAMMNDAIGEWVDAHPTRFIGTMVLPFQNMPATFSEIDRCAKQFNFKIVNAPTNVQGKYLGDPYFDEYWRLAEQRQLITFIHPEGVNDQWFQRYRLWNSVGQPMEETKTIASLIYEGVLERHPDLMIVMAHGGGYLPLYMGRLDRNVTNMPESVKNIRGLPSDYIQRLYYDTCLYETAALERMIQHVGVDRIVLGSDYPVGDPTPFHLLDQIKGLSAGDREKITGGNALALLKRAKAL